MGATPALTLSCESYTEAAKEMRIFRPVVEAPDRPRKRLRPEEVIFYGPVPEIRTKVLNFAEISFFNLQPDYGEQEQQKEKEMEQEQQQKDMDLEQEDGEYNEQEQQKEKEADQEDRDYKELFDQLLDYFMDETERADDSTGETMDVQDSAATSPTSRNAPEETNDVDNGAAVYVEFGGVNEEMGKGMQASTGVSSVHAREMT